jgi:hypothetical protein
LKRAAAATASVMKPVDARASEETIYSIDTGTTRTSINGRSGVLVLEKGNQRHELPLEKLKGERISRVHYHLPGEMLIIGYEVEKEDAGASFMVGIDLPEGRIIWEVQLQSFELLAFYMHENIIYTLTNHGLAKVSAQRGTLLWERDLLVFGTHDGSLVMLWLDVNTGEFLKRIQPVPGLCTGSRVRIRKAPGLESPVLGYLDRGEAVSLLRRSETKMRIDSMDDYWFEVSTDSRITGWSYGHFIAFDLSFTHRRLDTDNPEERLLQVLELLDDIDDSLNGLKRIDTLIGSSEEGYISLRLKLFYDGDNPVKLRVEEPGNREEAGTWISYYFEDGMLIFAQTPFSGYLFLDGRLILIANEYMDPLFDIPEQTRAEQERSIKERLRRYLSAYGFALK